MNNARPTGNLICAGGHGHVLISQITPQLGLPDTWEDMAVEAT